MVETQDEGAQKKERSPNFPFIHLERAVMRAKALHEKYRKEPARITVVGSVWNYGAKSSGLLQTVAALKQYGLAEDSGSGEARKVSLTPLALRILIDARPGMAEAAIREAAVRPRLFAEYAPKWGTHRPPDDHCISELSLERGFTTDAAKLFLNVFDHTMHYAGLDSDDTLSSNPANEFPEEVLEEATTRHHGAYIQVPPPVVSSKHTTLDASSEPLTTAPLAERLKVQMTVDALRVSATLTTAAEVDKLVAVLNANKALLADPEGQA